MNDRYIQNIMTGDDSKSEDDALWAFATQDITPLDPEKHKKNQKKSQVKTATKNQPPLTKPPKSQHSQTRISTNTEHKNARSDQMDKRTETRLRKGQLPIEGVIDLHGMTKDRAEQRLIGFITQNYNTGKRCLLVITGKGREKGDPLGAHKGVIKNSLPLWLSTPPLSPMILKHYTAKPKDGGSGAFYVYLRRKRS